MPYPMRRGNLSDEWICDRHTNLYGDHQVIHYCAISIEIIHIPKHHEARAGIARRRAGGVKRNGPGPAAEGLGDRAMEAIRKSEQPGRSRWEPGQ